MSPVRPTVQVVGRRMDANHYRLRDFLTRTAQPYEWHEAGSAEADLLLERLGLVDATLPVVVDGDKSLAGATVEAVMEAWGGYQPVKRKHYDFVVIGSWAGRACSGRLRRLGRPLDARLRPRRAGRPGLVRHHDRELLRLSGR